MIQSEGQPSGTTFDRQEHPVPETYTVNLVDYDDKTVSTVDTDETVTTYSWPNVTVSDDSDTAHYYLIVEYSTVGEH